jgi:sterol desaturase/sphingolipid hydroxylase (fatty acid hydroxylase superfamily)
LVLAAAALFVPWERIRPAAPSPLLLTVSNRSRAALRRLGRNLGLFSVNLLLSPLVVVPITLLADRWSLGWRPPALESTWAIGLDLLLLDLWIYWWHRANHEIPWLWRFHIVHHLDEWLDSSSAVRFHFGEVLLSAVVRGLVIVILDIQLASVLIFEGLVLAAAIFHHSDAALPPRLEAALSRIIVTPSIHWIHHHARRADTDSNYATILSIWDRLFGTRSATRRTPELRIGVERCRDRPLLRLLAVPLNGRLCREGDRPVVPAMKDQPARGEKAEQRQP